jgi:DNA invertase Pin-like site-specific DNA recombinase
MKIGYARVSSSTQNPQKQIDALQAFGVPLERIYVDVQSGKDFERTQYQAMLKALRRDDIVCIQSLDRLGRNYEQIRDEFARIAALGAFINVIDMPILNTNEVQGTLTGQFITDLVLSILSYVAEQERKNIKQRQYDGIQSAKNKNVKFGRPNVENKARAVDALIKSWSANGERLSINKACAMIGISRQAYYNNKK